MLDDFSHKGLRNKLLSEIEGKGVSNKEVLAALGKVPRHLFMDSGFIKFAYRDQAFPIGAGQTISQPFTVAFQSSLLQVFPRCKVLEIGTGSGYQAAVLLEMGAVVYSVERQKELYLKVKKLLPQIGYKPHLFYGDGYAGLPTYGPFDRILITAAAPHIPEALMQQMVIGGRLVVPVGEKGTQKMTLVERVGENDFRTTEHGFFSFVPMIKGKV